jgi:hypothetical protein
MDDQLSATEKGAVRDVEHPGGSKKSAFDAIKKFDPENAIVLRFISLQLKRIGELQAELLDLQERSARGEESEDLNKRIDETLQRYGESLADMRHCPNFKLTVGSSECITKLRDIIPEQSTGMPIRCPIIGTQVQRI